MRQNVINREGSWKFEEADWNKFRMHCEGKLKVVNVNQPSNDLNKEITNSIVEAARESIPKRAGSKRKKLVPLWTQECTKAIQSRNKAFKDLKKTLCFQNLIDYKRKQAMVRNIIKRTKREYWRKYCEVL